MIEIVLRGCRFGVDALPDGGKQVNFYDKDSGIFCLVPLDEAAADSLAELLLTSNEELERQKSDPSADGEVGGTVAVPNAERNGDHA